MLTKTEFTNKFNGIHKGMPVYTEDGEKLGKLASLDDDHITIERGLFFPKDFTLRYDDVAEVRDDAILLNHKRDDLANWKEKDYAGWAEFDRVNRGDEVRVPLREEELVAQKTIRKKGEIRVRKVVHTEVKNVTIPVTKEDVVVERMAVTETETTGEDAAKAFTEEEIRIPLMEEEVQVVKRPVTKEEIRIRKESRTTEETVSGEVRKEDVEVDRGDEKVHGGDQKKKAA